MELGPITPLELDDTKRLEELTRQIDWQATYNGRHAIPRDYPYFMELTRLMLNLSRRLDTLEHSLLGD